MAVPKKTKGLGLAQEEAKGSRRKAKVRNEKGEVFNILTVA
jgi:hypothetical protein